MGMLQVPHLFFPLWAGGHKILWEPYLYSKGSNAWFTLNFWWDYLYSKDAQFLRYIAYPIMRFAGWFFENNLKFQGGMYHVTESVSPEQEERVFTQR